MFFSLLKHKSKSQTDYLCRRTRIAQHCHRWWAHQHNRSLIPAGRPNLIQLVNCSGIEVTGVTLRDSPFWCLHPVYSTHVHVHDMRIRSRMYAPNSDGVR